MRRFGGRADGLRRLQEQFVDPDPLRIARLRFKSLQHSSGTITVRAQYEILERWNGNQLGSSMISTGITGTERQVRMPNSASMARVKTLLLAAPPRERIASRARRMCKACVSSPIILSAK
jgi:hypothetical protein